MFLEKIREERTFVPDRSVMGVKSVTRTVARCKCGEEILLADPMDNECDECGRIYNMSGQEVACYAQDVDYLDAGEEW